MFKLKELARMSLSSADHSKLVITLCAVSWELGTPEKKPGTGPYREMMKDGCAEQWEGPILDSRAEGLLGKDHG